MKHKIILFALNCIFSLVIALGITSAAYAQDRKFRSHEIVEIGRGQKVEIIACKGEGPDEICDCIYYIDKRQTGKRVMQPALLIRAEERSARKAIEDSIKALKVKPGVKGSPKKGVEQKIKPTRAKESEAKKTATAGGKIPKPIAIVQKSEKGKTIPKTSTIDTTKPTDVNISKFKAEQEISNTTKADTNSTSSITNSGNKNLNKKTEKKLSVFINCSNADCDLDFIKTNITLVDFLLERQAADVNILLTEQQNGGGGKAYQLIFYGQNTFKNVKDTMSYNVQPNSTAFEIREELAKYLKIGLIPFLSKTAYAKSISIRLEAPKEATTGSAIQTKDNWNYWVFRVGGNGSYNADQVYKSFRQSGYINANRTTDKLKLNFSVSSNFNTSLYTYEDNGSTVEYKVKNSDYQIQQVLIKSISEHWSAGYELAYSNSTFSNNKSRKYFKPTIEYSIFPYKVFNNKYLTVNYGVEARDNLYYDTTIFNKTSEILFGHRAMANLVLNQKWGTVNTSFRYSNYFHDWKLNNLSMTVNLEINITRGLSFYTYTSAGLVRDQITLLKGNATETEILTRRRQIASGYDFYSAFGLSYRFGSKLNNFVNPRMDPS